MFIMKVKIFKKISFQNGVIYGNGNILGYDKVGKDFYKLGQEIEFKVIEIDGENQKIKDK